MKLLSSLVLFLVTFGCSANPERWAEEVSLKNIEKKVSELWAGLLQHFKTGEDGLAYATCEIKPSSTLEPGMPVLSGQVLFRQPYPNGKLELIFDVEGFPKTQNQSGRAIHIHKFGDLSNGCGSTAGHYNPYSVNHPLHPGDFGNFYPKDGKIKKYKRNLRATMFGPDSILGRSVVVHEQMDDLGKGNNKASLENGNAGNRLACCVIGISSKNLWEIAYPSFQSDHYRVSQRDPN
ncbi:extracellular superoxide dismutase [Latimeria chalumnae]|uniref:Superoxide dismutase [Cu-Zn] n=1 Tax=Latimeria chalumnae TaxID=7897 RepID=H3ABI2_LATCH|nr:PREDICTED: extracellular superoxide dismutase [Cu-Zn] [Latimeria chalumnae]|eukprot:XP_005997921.1 PREDICTED: extracellular superoxide dismutase [Cu-Zn] [Latimeria chalumnae]